MGKNGQQQTEDQSSSNYLTLKGETSKIKQIQTFEKSDIRIPLLGTNK